MKRVVPCVCLLAVIVGASLAVFSGKAQDKKPAEPATLRSVLLAQLKSTHDSKEWFVPVNVALEGVTAEQAKWTDGKGNHSVGQLAYHLLFWNQRQLVKYHGEKPAAFSGSNDETFTNFDAATWASTVQQLDKVLADLEKFVETVDEARLKTLAPDISHMATHNAYHTGQIIYIRRQQGSWDPEKGVK